MPSFFEIDLQEAQLFPDHLNELVVKNHAHFPIVFKISNGAGTYLFYTNNAITLNSLGKLFTKKINNLEELKEQFNLF